MLTVAAVAAGVALVTTVTSTHATLHRSVLEFIRRWTGPADVVVALEGPARDFDHGRALARIRALAGVSAADAALAFGLHPILINSRSAPQAERIRVVGLPAEGEAGGIDPARRMPELAAGRVFSAGERDVIVLDQALAQRLNVRVGDAIGLPTMWAGFGHERAAASAKVVGICKTPPAPPPPAAGAPPPALGPECFAPIGSAREWSAEPGWFNQIDVALSADAAPERRRRLVYEIDRILDGWGKATDAAPQQAGTGRPTDMTVRFEYSSRRRDECVEYLAKLPGVKTAFGRLTHYPLRVGRAGGEPVAVRVTGIQPADAEQSEWSARLLSGRLPAAGAADEIALDSTTVQRLGAAVGDAVELPAMLTGTPFARSARSAKLVGVLRPDPTDAGAGVAAANLPAVREWVSEPDLLTSLHVVLEPDVSVERAGDLQDEVIRLFGTRIALLLEHTGDLAVALNYDRPHAPTTDLVAQLAKLPGVRRAGPRLSFWTFRLRARNAAGVEGPALRPHGIKFPSDGGKARFAGREPLPSAGRLPRADEPDAVLIDATTAAALKIAPGAELVFPALADGAPVARPQRTVRVVGVLPADRETFADGSGVVVGRLDLLRELCGEAGRTTHVDLSLAADLDRAKIGEIRREAARLTGARGRVFAGASRIDVLFPASARDERLLAEIRSVPGVSAAGPRLFHLARALPISSDKHPQPLAVQLLGVPAAEGDGASASFERLPPLTAGRPFRPGEEGAILIDDETAGTLQVGLGDRVLLPALRSGDQIERAEESAVVVGIMQTARIGRAKSVGTAACLLSAAQRRMNQPDAVNRIDAALDEDISPARRSRAVAEIGRLTGPRGRVQAWDSRREQIEINLGLVKLVIQLMSMAALLASVFIVLNTLSINMVERIGLFGMLRCLGMTRSQTAMLVFAEALMFGAAGLIIGVPLGLLGWRVVLAIFPEHAASAVISWDGIGVAAVGGLAGVVAAAVWPALRAASVSPSSAVRAAAGEGRHWFQRNCWIFGLGCLALEAALLWGIPHPGTKVFIHLFFGLPLIFLGYFFVSPGVVRLIGPATAALSRGLGRVAAAAAAAVGVRRAATPVPAEVAGELRRNEHTLAPAVCALMVGAGFVLAIAINSEGLLAKMRRALPSGFPDIYAVGIGSYSEELAYRYFLGNADQVKAARENPFADPEATRLAEQVQFAGEERDWHPFVREWRAVNGKGAGEPAGLADLYVQEVELTRPPVPGLEGLIPRDAVMVSVDPQTLFDVLPMKLTAGDRETVRRRLTEGGAVLVPHSFLSAITVEPGYKFEVNLEGDPTRPSKTFEVVGVAELGVLEMIFMYIDPTAGPDSLTVGVFLTGKRDAVAAIDARGLRDQGVRYKSRGALRQSKLMLGNLSSSAPPDSLERLRGSSRNLVVDSIRKLLDELVVQLQRVVAILSAVGWVTMAVAGLGTANVMFMKILRRRRELGILRALGMTRTQAAELVLTDAAVVGVLGGLMGTVLGIHLALAGRHLDWIIFGMNYDFEFPVGFVLATIAVSAAVCVTASLIPARRAARMKITAALSRAV